MFCVCILFYTVKYENMLRTKKYWFTLAEVVVACSIFAIVVVWIILAINRSFSFMNNIKLSVRATNFAREWVEMMYNIRDTNWRKHSWYRDKLWLYLGQGTIRDDWNSDYLFSPWIYLLKEWTLEENTYLYAEKLDVTDVDEFYSNDGFWDEKYDTDRQRTKISLDWTYSYYEWDENIGDNGGWKTEPTYWNVEDALIWDWLEFYRIVRVFGVYKKNTDKSDDNVKNNESAMLSNWTPAELRFCVKVFYASQWKHSSEICSIMTNFME